MHQCNCGVGNNEWWQHQGNWGTRHYKWWAHHRRMQPHQSQTRYGWDEHPRSRGVEQWAKDEMCREGGEQGLACRWGNGPLLLSCQGRTSGIVGWQHGDLATSKWWHGGVQVFHRGGTPSVSTLFLVCQLAAMFLPHSMPLICHSVHHAFTTQSATQHAMCLRFFGALISSFLFQWGFREKLWVFGSSVGFLSH